MQHKVCKQKVCKADTVEVVCSEVALDEQYSLQPTMGESSDAKYLKKQQKIAKLDVPSLCPCQTLQNDVTYELENAKHPM